MKRDGGVAILANTNCADASARDLLKETHVILCVLWKLFKRAAAADVFRPTRQVFINRPGVVEVSLRSRHLIHANAIDLVRDTDRDGLPASQHIELGQEEVSQTVDASRVTSDHSIEPAAATWATGGHTNFATDATQVLAILVENMRREGYEMQVSQPQVIIREEGGKKLEPFEEVIIDTPSEFQGAIIEKLGQRAFVLQNLTQHENLVRLTMLGPTRGLLGYKNIFVVDTKGEGILSSRFVEFKPVLHAPLLADWTGAA